MSRWPEREAIGDPDDPRGFEALIARYLEWLDVRQYAASARKSYVSNLRLFARWCSERGIDRPSEVTRAVAERYQRSLFHYRQANGKPLAARTQIGRLVMVQGFFRWLAKQRYVIYDPTSVLELPRKPTRRPVEAFEVDEVEAILRSLDVREPVGLRDRTLLELLYSTGLRRAEAASLDLYDIDSSRGWVTVREGKDGKSRVVPIGDRALGWLGRYLEDGRPHLMVRTEEWAVFLTSLGDRFSPSGLGNRVRQIVRSSGVRDRRGSCHLFRHTMATRMLENGADVRFVQEMLGHARLETTQLYTQVSIEKLKEVHTATHPAKAARTPCEEGES